MTDGIFEVLSWICEECRGECCLRFMIYYIDRNGFLRTMDEIKYKDVGPRNRWELTTSGKMAILPGDFGYQCHFYKQGGCPKSMKPSECKEWFCKYQEAVIFGNQIPDSYHGLSMKLRLIYRGAMKDEPTQNAPT